jgi:hypothetical protein
MKLKYIIALTLVTISLLNACKTDVDVIAPYREMAVVYGLLDVSQGIQYVKINKIFSGIGDANDFAQNPDSINFNPDDMNIILEKYNGTNFVGSITLIDTILNGGESGNFSKQKNIIYYTTEAIQADLNYTLKIENKKTGYKAQAKTAVIKNIALENNATRFSFVGTDNKYTTNTTIRWTSQTNAKIYELTFRFHYKEFKNGNDTVFKFVDWNFTPQYSSGIEGGVAMDKKINGEDFFAFLKTIKPDYFSDNSVRRIGWRGQVFVTAAGEEFQIYKDLNAPFSSNFQEKPVYTNVENGIGIFSTRITSFGDQKPFSTFTLNELTDGSYTNDLGFIKP